MVMVALLEIILTINFFKHSIIDTNPGSMLIISFALLILILFLISIQFKD